jgi:hypothetical protein
MASARDGSYLALQFVVAWMRVDRRCERARVAREPLGKEEIPRGSVDVGHRRVTKRMEGVEAIEAGADLAGTDGHLDSAARDATTGEGAEKRSTGLETFPAIDLVPPESSKFQDQGIGEENVSRSPTLGDLGSHPDAESGLAIGEEDVAHVEASKLPEAKSGSQGKGYNEMVSRVRLAHPEQPVLFGGGEGLWREMGHE